MANTLGPSHVKQRLSLPSGEQIVLVDLLNYPKLERGRNIYRLDRRGEILWRVSSLYDAEGSPFTQLHDEAGQLTAYRWDGGTYGIDAVTGAATPLRLDR